MKNYSKIKQTQKLGYRTPDHFKAQVFGGPASRLGGQKVTRAIGPRFNPAQFKTQHRG